MRRPKKHNGIHRSKFETNFLAQVTKKGFNLDYETSVLAYVSPVQKRKYNPDWTIKPGWYIETKGRFTSSDRKKILLVKEQHPEARILIVFQRQQNKLYKGSPTSYTEWCKANDVECCGFEEQDKWLKFIQEAIK